MSVAITAGVRVSVSASFLPQQSDPNVSRYAFSYTVTIANEGTETVQLKSRHWLISDSNDNIEEVQGEGVVGEQPVLEPDDVFEYTSGCVLKTPWGTMKGTYQMYNTDGSRFDAEIAAFLLAAPYAIPCAVPSAP